MNGRGVQRRFFDGALIIVFALVAFIVVARAGLAPTNPAEGVAVVFTPWTPSDAVLTRAVAAGARFVRFGGVSFIAIVVPEADDYVERVRTDGALFVLDPQIILACLKANPQ
jgi:hypothetical protein